VRLDLEIQDVAAAVVDVEPTDVVPLEIPVLRGVGLGEPLTPTGLQEQPTEQLADVASQPLRQAVLGGPVARIGERLGIRVPTARKEAREEGKQPVLEAPQFLDERRHDLREHGEPLLG
jgi:hypothetical protein